MQDLVLSALATDHPVVEVVERKGIGHPDTICDALAETLSRNLCRAYLDRFGQVLHHNVDKALLCGGQAAAAFGGGTVLAPIEMYLAGRATARFGSLSVPIKDIAIEGSRDWLRRHLHALDAHEHIRIHERIRPGSQDLQELFVRKRSGMPVLANDTSIGVGYAPLSALERLVLAIERRINPANGARERAAWGEDVKIMGIRRGTAARLTVACATISRHLARMDDYLAEKERIARLAHELAAMHGFPDCEVAVNAADEPVAGKVYLTVTGTSAEAGDDGQVGRGNRVNGLITPGRPMSLEAAAGKNPVSHVGKIYNVLAREIAETLAAEAEIAAAHCLLVSRIGKPITEPDVIEIGLVLREAGPVARFEPRVAEVAADRLARAPKLIEDFVAGSIGVF